MTRILAIILIFLFSTAQAQKKKEIKKHHIKSITVVETKGNTSLMDSKNTFDKKGLMVEDVNYSKEGVVKSITRYKYNNEGDVILEEEFDANSVLKERRTIKYKWDPLESTCRHASLSIL